MKGWEKIDGGYVRNAFRSQLTAAMLLTADTTLGAGWTLIGAGYPVPAGRAIKIGTGKFGGQHEATGRLYFDIIDDAAGAEDGLVRFAVSPPTRIGMQLLLQYSTVTGRSADADTRAGQIPMPEQPGWIPENSFIEVWMLGDAAADIVDVSACFLFMDVLEADFRVAI